jgi:hypothetical protein
MTSRKQHPAELRERAVAMVFELRAASGSSRGTLASVGQKLGINPERAFDPVFSSHKKQD